MQNEIFDASISIIATVAVLEKHSTKKSY